MQAMMLNAAEAFRISVRTLIEERETTITAVAHGVGMQRPSLSRILAGKEGVTLDRAQRIADHFDVPLAQLLSNPRKLQKTA